MAQQISSGLHWLHIQDPPIVHRDVKSSNVLVTKNWGCKVADFGLSGFHNYLDRDLKGTPSYMAPEVWESESSGIPRDVYAYGIVFWELVFQPNLYTEYGLRWPPEHVMQLETRNERIAELRNVICNGEHPPIPEGTASTLKEFLLSCWAVNPDDRPPLVDAEEDIYSKIHHQVVIENIGGEDFWVQVASDEMEEVPWKTFLESLLNYVNCPDASIREKYCLGQVLVDDFSKEAHVSEETVVTRGNAARFSNWFSYVGKEALVKTVYKLLQKKWFYGDMTKEDIKTILNSAVAGTTTRKKFMMITFSQQLPSEAFTIHYCTGKDGKFQPTKDITKSKDVHNRIARVRAYKSDYPDISSYVKKYLSGYSAPVGNRKYAYIFQESEKSLLNPISHYTPNSAGMNETDAEKEQRALFYGA
eukprot:TRINITY_DN1088_c0_g1_i4.p1 TRINITY_DN1088_c0_g1~~TRINITY_DN1088_c0_g1_i4.p1  ORF type:complete len:417 (-),score=94.79 TRINITY_DN1088_c0_g1_i4:40-1290(-)